MQPRRVSAFVPLALNLSVGLLVGGGCGDVGHDEHTQLDLDDDASGGSDFPDGSITAPPGTPRSGEPPCDDDGDCCPEGTTPVLGTVNADVFNTSTPGLCHVALGGSDVVNNTSAGGLHAALGGPGTDTLYGGFGPAILAGGDDGDTLTGRNADDELYGQDGNDNLYGHGGNDKGFGGEGNDTVSLGEGNNEADGGPGNDTLNTGSGIDVLRGGAGNDVLNAGGGADDVRGNSGDDTLNGGPGDDVLVGGPGKDIINAGSGNDVVIIYDVCELVPGEVYNGDGGTDTLQIPVPLAEVQALGVVVNGFENVVEEVVPVTDDTPLEDVSECRMCGCAVVQGAVECCNGNGTCDAVNNDGRLFCTCDAGFLGPSCDLEEGTQYEPRNCPPNEPSCEAPAYSIVEALEFDLTGNPICDDLPGVADQIAGHDNVLRTALFHPTISDLDPNWPAGEFPTVVWVHGQGHTYTNYEDLMSFLASNNVAAISIEVDDGKSVGTRAHLQVCVRRLLPDDVAIADHVDFEAIGLGGHSRGGEATVIAANLWADEAPQEIASAVVSLAASLNCQAGGACAPPGLTPQDFAGLFELRDDATDAYLSILGTQDGDVTGKGLEIYELASSEHVVAPDYTHKANVYVFGVPHNTWGGIGNSSNAPNAKGNVLARTYVANFFRWRVQEEPALRSLFLTQVLPPCLEDPGLCGYEDFSPLLLFNQYLEGTADGGQRNVIFDFTAPIVPGATFEATPPATAEVVLAEGSNPPFSGQLNTAALQVTWLQPTDVDLEFPNLIDSAGASFLGFRVSKQFNGTANPCQVTGDAGVLAFEVSMEDDSTQVATLAAEDFAQVTDPDHPDVGPQGAPLCAHDFFQTFRIPLSAFASQGVNVNEVARISFHLPAQNSGNPGKVLLDTVEFTGAPADAQCGNFVVEAGEECDDGNLIDEDACKSDCTFNVCGDGVVNPDTEECDDGNVQDGDGCSSVCENECGPADDGTEGCPCLAADTCADAFLSCKFPDDNSPEKLCLPCDLGGDVGRGCPCNNVGAACTPDEFDFNNQSCWKHPEAEWRCWEAWPGDPHGVPRCWDFNPDFFGSGFCTFGSGENQCPLVVPPEVCVGGLCEDSTCGGQDGTGVCRAAMLLCDEIQGECIPAPQGCEWPQTVDASPPNGCNYGLDWCPQP